MGAYVEAVAGGGSVLGSLRVSQVLSGRESGRYLIVIASMERTEAGPVRKFLIYLVFLFSLLFLLHPPPLFARRRGATRGGGAFARVGPWMKPGGGGGRQCGLLSQVWFQSLGTSDIPPPPQPPLPVRNEKSVIFIKRPTKYYLPSIPGDRTLFRGDGIRHLFSDFIPP